MACHYRPYFEQYKIERLHKPKLNSEGANKSALIIVNVQKEFVSGGGVPINSGTMEVNQMVNSINELIMSGRFDYHVYVQDAHLKNHITFSSSHKHRDGSPLAPFEVTDVPTKSGTRVEMTWPDHCRTDGHGDGINFHPELIVPLSRSSCVELYNEAAYIKTPITQVTTNQQDIETDPLMAKSRILWNGQEPDIIPFSAFKDADGNETTLRSHLVKLDVKDLYICGIGRDFAVWWTAVDATTYVCDETGRSLFNVNIVWDASLPVPGHNALPDYLTSGSELSKHQEQIKEIGLETVYSDLTKDHVPGNNWIKAFLTPYGVNAVSHQDAGISIPRITYTAMPDITPDKLPVSTGPKDMIPGVIDAYDDRNNDVYNESELDAMYELMEDPMVKDVVGNDDSGSREPERFIDLTGYVDSDTMPDMLKERIIKQHRVDQMVGGGGSIFSQSNVKRNGKRKLKVQKKTNNCTKKNVRSTMRQDPDVAIFLEHMFVGTKKRSMH